MSWPVAADVVTAGRNRGRRRPVARPFRSASCILPGHMGLELGDIGIVKVMEPARVRFDLAAQPRARRRYRCFKLVCHIQIPSICRLGAHISRQMSKIGERISRSDSFCAASVILTSGAFPRRNRLFPGLERKIGVSPSWRWYRDTEIFPSVNTRNECKFLSLIKQELTQYS